ncbi:MAG: DUF4351 domain-containing protein, partial [Alcaligenaceae bacterium]|nr:DUF4351 domain-containing protein [Alcaligenaceae bacterium]
YPDEHIHALLRLIDWVIAQPAALEPLFAQAMSKIEREHKMAFVTSFERVGIRKGEIKGRIEGKLEGKLEGEADLVLRLLARKFGPVPTATRQRVQTATFAQLETWSLNILDAGTLEDVFSE